MIQGPYKYIMGNGNYKDDNNKPIYIYTNIKNDIQKYQNHDLSPYPIFNRVIDKLKSIKNVFTKSTQDGKIDYLILEI